MLRVASTMGESLIWQPAIYLADKFSLSQNRLSVRTVRVRYFIVRTRSDRAVIVNYGIAFTGLL